jgi:hypothetical protein
VRTKLERLCEKLRIKCETKYGGVDLPEGWDPRAHPYRVRLRFRGRSLTVPFYMGPALEREPTAADVLACLCSDVSMGEQSFEDFCSELGYDTDSRKAERTWKACSVLAPKVRRFLGDHFGEVSSAEH